jgi:transmembrane sensor
MTTPASLREIELVAVNWVAEMEGGLSPQLQAKLESWLESDMRHRIALLRAHHAWERARELSKYLLTELAYATDLSVDARYNSGPDATIELQSRNDYAPAVRRLRRVLTRRQWLATACVGVVLALLLATLSRQYASRTAEQVAYGTSIGEHKSTTLADGSVIVLNANSRLHVESGSAKRIVRLVRGEAYFKIAHNAKKEFVVIAGDVVVRDVGTAFAVRALQDGHIEVLVAEGTVQVEFPTPESSSPDLKGQRAITTVSAGQSASIRAGHVSVARLSSTEVDCKLGWREGTLCFMGETVAEAVEEFNRYNQRRLIMDDPFIANWHIVGVFSAAAPEDFADTVNREAELIPTSRRPLRGPCIHLEPPRIAEDE